MYRYGKEILEWINLELLMEMYNFIFCELLASCPMTYHSEEMKQFF